VIDRPLNQGFLVEQLELAGAELDKRHEDEGEAEPGVEEARKQVKEAITELARRKEPMTSQDRKAFMPTNQIMSVLQTVIEEQLRDHPALLKGEPGFDDPGGPVATEVLSLKAPEEGDDFGPSSPEWPIHIAEALVERTLRGRHDFVETKSPPEGKLENKTRILLVGDWGTGGPSAKAVSMYMRKEIDSAKVPVHVVHLGDIYYSGENWEAEERFLDHWPVRKDEAKSIGSWSVPGNHDMYSGGYGFYDVVLADERFACQRDADAQRVSYFRLHNDHWQILGLDTSWDDHLIPYGGHSGFLKDPQADWIATSVRERGKRKTMLLSHHQLYSTHEDKVHGNVAEKLKAAFAEGGIDAWFWGHEHRCMPFRRHEEVRYAACVGHGAMPEPAGHAKPDDGLWEYDKGHPDADGDQWRWCGFARLDLDDERIEIAYINECGEIHNRDTLPRDD
jgi:hypothetical protein